jgi:hypothetical protein
MLTEDRLEFHRVMFEKCSIARDSLENVIFAMHPGKTNDEAFKATRENPETAIFIEVLGKLSIWC